jgi:2,4-dienoyl-CoA reductase (NADPH2)
VGREGLREFAVRAVEAGADALCVNVGWHEAVVPQIVTKVPRGVFGYLARGIRESVSVPVIASHRINDPETAREMIEDGVCDMVAMGRALIADPFLPEKARTGREEEILHCVACGQGCFDNLFKMKAVECLCNPLAGHEEERSLHPIARGRRVMVIGGGAAGMSAALVAAGRGHEVILHEKSERLGGQLHLAGAPPGREEFAVLARDLARQVAIGGIRVELGREVDAATIEAEQPEAVVLATGGTSIQPPIPGRDRDCVVQAWDVLSGRARVGKRVVVVGGGAVGVETALALAEKGTLSGEALKFLLVHGAEKPEELLRMAVRGTREIVLVEMLEKMGTNFGRTTRWGMLQDLERFGIRTLTASKALEITAEGITIEKGGQVEEIPADTVVLAVGTRSHNPLQEVLAKKGIPFSVAGDALQVGMAIDAIHQGFAAGREIA